MAALIPEQQLRNVATALLEYTQVTRDYNGRGRPSTYAARVDTIASTGRQLAQMVMAYIDGQLAPVSADDDCPF